MKDDLYYIRSCYAPVGNSVLWWRPRSAGYTVNLAEAGKYVYEMVKTIVGMKRGDIAYECSAVDNLAKLQVDIGKLMECKEVKRGTIK
jgi:hypothetical protein